jgi:acetamidase/formamidase
MKTKSEIIAELKAEYPTLRDGSEELGYRQLTVEQYEDTIERWAGWILYQEELEAAAEKAVADKAALLARLGITEDEAQLLLGGN